MGKLVDNRDQERFFVEYFKLIDFLALAAVAALACAALVRNRSVWLFVAGILVAIWGAMRITGWPEIALEPKLIDVATDNLTSLHKHEEQLRARSLAVIEADAGLSDHWNLVAEAMSAIYAFSHDHPHESEDELTLQYLGIRSMRLVRRSNSHCRGTIRRRSTSFAT